MMKHRSILKLACLTVLMLGAQSLNSRSQAEQGNPDMEQAKIQSAIDANNAAVAAGDMDAIMATYEPAAVMLAQPGKPSQGTEALRGAFQYFLALNPKITMTGKETVQAGDIALHMNKWQMTGKTPDGQPVEQSGFSIVVLRKQADGRWLMVIDNPFGDHLLSQK